jgi:hypothetical protein
MDEMIARAGEPSSDSRKSSMRDLAFLRRLSTTRTLLCPVCLAPVGAMTRPACPHCNVTVALGVGAGEPGVSRVWTALATAVCLAGGLGVFVLLIVLNEGWPGRTRGGAPELQASLAYFIANIPVALLAIFKRRAFRRLPDVTQLVLAVGAWTGTVAAFAALFFGIR